MLGLLAAIFATLLGTAAAIGLVRFRFKGRETLEAFFLAPLFIPEILFGAALYLTYARLGIKPSIDEPVIRARRRLRAIRDPQRDGRPCWAGPASRGGSNESWREPRAGLRQGRSAAHSVEHHLGLHLRRSSSHSRTSIWRCSLPDPTAQRCPSTFSICYCSKGDPSVAAASTLQILIVGLLIWLVQYLFRPRTLV